MKEWAGGVSVGGRHALGLLLARSVLSSDPTLISNAKSVAECNDLMDGARPIVSGGPECFC